MHSLISATLVLLLVTDPLGNIPIFVSALQQVAPARRGRVILREVLIAYVVLLLFLAIGNPLMRVLNLSGTSLGLTGGVVLFLIAVRMIFPSPQGVWGDAASREPLIVPLAIPSLAGPSALATVMLLVAREPQHVARWVLALTVVMLVNAIVLRSAEWISRALGDRVVAAFERLMGLILAAVAIEMVLEGIRAFVHGLGAAPASGY